MTHNFHPWAAAIVCGLAVLTVGCDGSWRRRPFDRDAAPSIVVPSDDGAAHADLPHILPRDGPADLAASGAAGHDGGPTDVPADEDPFGDAGLVVDSPRDIATAPLPSGVEPARRIIPGPARLVGTGATACSNQEPASGDGSRWCAFRRPAAGGSGTELWVFNVSAAMAGTMPVCDGSSGGCLRMTDSLWTDDPFGGPPQAMAHRFDGDTLLFHTAGTSGKDAPFRGPVSAWRPGWTQPRRLSDIAMVCFGHGRFALAFCIDNADQSPAIEFDLRAGSIAAATGNPLPIVDRARVRRGDAEQAFLATFTRDGSHFIYSSTPSAESTRAALRIVSTEQLGQVPPREILPDVVDWSLSNDEQRIYYLAGFKPETAEGALMMADFPSGEKPQQMARRTGRYVVLGDGSDADRGVGYFVPNTGRFLSEYRVVPHRDDLASARTVFRYKDLLEDFHLSRDQQYTGYAKFDATEGFNGYIARNDGSGECILNSQRGRPAFEYEFLDHSGLVFWAEEAQESTTLQDAWFADPARCLGKQRFASGIGFYRAVRDEGLVFGDQYDGNTVSLNYAVIAGGRHWPSAGAVRVRDGVDLPLVLLGARTDHVLFQVSRGPEGDNGIHLFGPMPFGSPPGGPP